MNYLAAALLVVFAGFFGMCNGSSAPTDTRTASDVIAGFKSDSLPIANSIDFTSANDPQKLLGRPGQYTSRSNFHDNRIFSLELLGIDAQQGGSVEVFASAEDALKRMQALAAIVKVAPALTEYDFQQGAIVLRVSRNLTPDQAEAYHQSLVKGAGKK